ncbi:MFS transporter [Amycolatopsis antarctica]|uniref:MFS transporter n=1 Tax=Amycolatopsis antarctica TaxID=1854586 RepID=UPI0013FDB4B5|nr:MFS transporter [Amycolatopsis antarctica]
MSAPGRSEDRQAETAEPARRSRFLPLWLSTACSGLADGVYLMVLPLIALTLTTSPALIAGVRVAQTAAGLIFGLAVGVLVDRFDRRKLIIYAGAIRGAAMAGLAAAIALDALTLPLVFVAAFVIGTAECVSDTAGQAIVPMVVERDGLRRANGRIYGTQTVTNDFVGAPLGAALLGLSTVVAVLTPAGLYLIAAVALLPLAGRFTAVAESGTPTTVMQEMWAGVKSLWDNVVLRRIAMYGAISNFTNSAFFAVFILFAVGGTSAMGLSSFQYGLLLTAAAAGAVSGASLADRVCRSLSPRVVLTGVVLALGLCFATPVLTSSPPLVALVLAASGFVTAIGGVMTVSLRQTLAPANLIGRVAAGSRLLSLAARPLGALAGGAVSQVSGPRGLFVVLAVVVLTALPLTVRLRAGEPG